MFSNVGQTLQFASLLWNFDLFITETCLFGKSHLLCCVRYIMTSPRNILLLDNDEQSAQDIQRFLKVSAYAFAVSHASDVNEGLNYLKNRKPDLVLLDGDLLRKKEFATLKSIADREKIPFVLLADMTNAEAEKQARTAGAVDYLVKNKINLFHLQRTIVNALKLNEVESKLDDTYNDFSAQQQSISAVLNKISDGVMVINAQNQVRFANVKAYSILGEGSLRKHLADYLRYREVEQEEEQFTLQPQTNLQIKINVSELSWNGEAANLFVFQRYETLAPIEQSLLALNTFSAFINTLQERILILKDKRVVLVNQAAQKLLQLKAVNILHKPVADFFHGDDFLTENLSLQSFLADMESEGEIRLKDGASQAIRYMLKPMNLAGDFYQLFTFEPVQTSEERAMPGLRTEEEDKFSSENVLHLASHDLREPVRTILNYVQLVADKLSERKFEEAAEYNEFAMSAASRMERLLSDLKTYISLNNHSFTLAKVSTKLSVSDVLKSAKQRIEESGAEINIAELPDISADRDLIEKLFAQLIDNAIKFAKKGKKPVVDIGYDKFEGEVIFCVRDNGIGISKKYHHKIFELFERLNRVDEYSGNGLGLAICQKIVEMHGGSIWVESLPGLGSGFYFTLQPK